MTIRFEAHKTIVIILFALFLGLGLSLVKDYGISFDEREQRDLGMNEVYFNNLAGRSMKEIKGNFELDYWGLSYSKAF